MARKRQRNATPPLLPDLEGVPVAAPLRPLPTSVQELFLPGLVAEAAKNIQQAPYEDRRRLAREVVSHWITRLRSGQLRDLSETQVEQDFTTDLLGALGYTTQGQVLPGQVWTMQPKWSFPGGGQADVALGLFQHESDTGLSGKPIVVVELKGARHDLDRPDPMKKRTPVQQAFDYLTASDTARWALVSNYAEFRLYHRDKGRNHVFRVALESLADPATFDRFFAVLHADSLLSDARLSLNAAELLKRTSERQEKVGRSLYASYNDNRFRLIQVLERHPGVPDRDTAIAKAQKLLDRVLFIAFAEDRKLLDDNHLLETTFSMRSAHAVRLVELSGPLPGIDEGHPRSRIPKFDGTMFRRDEVLDDPSLDLDESWPNLFKNIGEYDFKNEVTVEVLGHIFEQSINDLEKLRTEGDAAFLAELDERKIMEQKTVSGRRKREGVYYTNRDDRRVPGGSGAEPRVG